MKTDAQGFFNGLATRLGSENNLSDVTYAMCKGSKVFFQFFLDFFFRGFSLSADEMEISREQPDEWNNRPDFRIESNYKGVFYVEVKIWDRNQHFSSYPTALKSLNPQDGHDEEKTKKRLGYIVNYAFSQPGYVVHRWKELIEELKRYDYFNDEAIRGYAEFVKSVCGLGRNDDVDSYRFNPQDFTNIRNFMDNVLGAIDHARGEGVTPYHRNRAKCFQPNLKMGKVFELANFRGTGKAVWGWFGCFINGFRPEIVVQFENQRGWGDLVCQVFNAPHAQERSVYYDDYDQSLYFYMVETDRNLNEFFDRVLNTIKGPYDPGMPAFPSQKQFEKYDYLLSMRRFPQAATKWLIEESSDLGEGYWIEKTGEDGDPSTRNHVVFQIHKDADVLVSGWVGVDYGKDANDNILAPRLHFGLGSTSEIELPAPAGNSDLRALAPVFREKLRSCLRTMANAVELAACAQPSASGV